MRQRHVADVAHHAGRLAQQGGDVHVDGVVAEVLVVEDHVSVIAGFADEGDRATLALAEALEKEAILGANGQDIALLRLATPDFHGAHGGLVVVHCAELEGRARGLDEFGAAVREAAGADVVDGEDGVVRAEGHAGVDDALATALHFGVTALDGVEVQLCFVRAGGHGAGGAAAQTNAHGRTADLRHEDVRRDLFLQHLVVADVAHAAGQHDGLVIAPVFAAGLLLKRTEEAAELRTAELVAESGPADGAFHHDAQRGREALGAFAVVLFPGLAEVRNLQVAHAETADAGLGTATDAGGALVADFAANARGRAGVGGDGGGVVVRLHLHQHLHLVLGETVDVVARVGLEGLDTEAVDDAGIVLIRHLRAFRVQLVGVANHAKEGEVALLTVNNPLGIEDFVAAVLAVDLAEHGQLGVGGVTLGRGVGVEEVINLGVAQRQADFLVGALQGHAALAQHIEDLAARGLRLNKETFQLFGGEDAFDHAVMDGVCGGAQVDLGEHLAVAGQGQVHRTLHAEHAGHRAGVEDVRGLGAPGRDGAQARRHEDPLTRKRIIAGIQQSLCLFARLGRERALRQHREDPARAHLAPREPRFRERLL